MINVSIAEPRKLEVAYPNGAQWISEPRKLEVSYPNSSRFISYPKRLEFAYPVCSFDEIDYMEYASDALAQAAYLGQDPTKWSINGVGWTGTIKTVGATGRDYTSLQTAMQAAKVDTLFLVDAGTYNDAYIDLSGKNLKYYVHGCGTSAADTIVNLTGSFATSGAIYLISATGTFLFDNLSFVSPAYNIIDFSAITDNTATVAINRCNFIAKSYDITFGEAGYTHGNITISNSYLQANAYHFTYLELNKISLSKVSYDSPWRALNCTGTLAVDDKAVEGTSGYGYNYGTSLITNTESAELIVYSETSIIAQGTYALKATASTSSSGHTTTKTFSPVKDLSGIDTIRFYLRASRTGEKIKFGVHNDDTDVTSETTPNVTSANTWQLFNLDLSGVADADKNSIDKFIITIVNADAANTFYIDKVIYLNG